jgi:cytochrome c oxidase cbb3-type subunit I
MFGASTCIAGVYYIVPRAFGCMLYSRRLARAQFALYIIGFLVFFTGFLVGGAIQGSDWVHAGLPVWTVLPALRPWGALRIMGGVLLVTSFMMFVWNVFATMIVRRPFELPEIKVKTATIASSTPTLAGE